MKNQHYTETGKYGTESVKISYVKEVTAMLVKKSKKKTRYSGETTRRQLGTNDCFFFQR